MYESWLVVIAANGDNQSAIAAAIKASGNPPVSVSAAIYIIKEQKALNHFPEGRGK